MKEGWQIKLIAKLKANHICQIKTDIINNQ